MYGDADKGFAHAPRTSSVDSDYRTKIFHAGTRVEGGHVVTSGGRVLCICALGETVEDAQKRAYSAVAGISWHGAFHRHDIGWRAIERERG